MPIRENQQVYIRWENINYYVQETKWTNLFQRKKIDGLNSSMQVDFDSISPDGIQKNNQNQTF